MARNAPPVDFHVSIAVTRGGEEHSLWSDNFIWTISDTNRLAGKLHDLTGNEGESVRILLPQLDASYAPLSWYIVTGLPPGLVYDPYWGIIMGRIDYVAVSAEELVRDYQVNVEFHDGDSLDQGSFTFTVGDQEPPERDQGLGIVVYGDRDLAVNTAIREDGEVVVANRVAFRVALNKAPPEPVTLNISISPTNMGLSLLFRVHSPSLAYEDEDLGWSEHIQITLDGTNWENGHIVEARISGRANLCFDAEVPLIVEMVPQPFLANIPIQIVRAVVAQRMLAFADQQFWQSLARRMVMDAKFQQDMQNLMNIDFSRETRASIVHSIARAWNTAITARYADGFTQFRSIAQLQQDKQAEAVFNHKYAWYGLAAFASDAVGEAMKAIYQALPNNPALWEEGLIVNFLKAFSTGNQAVYSDIYWQLLAYHFGGGLIAVMNAGSPIVNAWQDLHADRLDEGVERMLVYEQTKILQPVVFEQVKQYRRRVIAAGFIGGTGAGGTIGVIFRLFKLNIAYSVVSVLVGGPVGAGVAHALLRSLESSMTVKLWNQDIGRGIPAAPAPDFADILDWRSPNANMDRYRFLFGPDWGQPGGNMKGLTGTWLDIVDRARGQAGARTSTVAANQNQALEWVRNRMIPFKRRV